MNQPTKGIERKNQETLTENKTIEHQQTRIEFCYTWVGIISIDRFDFQIGSQFKISRLDYMVEQKWF